MTDLEQKLLDVIESQSLQIMSLTTRLGQQNDRLLEELLAQRELTTARVSYPSGSQ